MSKIGDGAFLECKSLKSFSFPEQVTSVPATCFGECTNLTEVNLTNNIQSIGESAFNESGIKSIRIPSSVKKISQSAFSFCDQLKDVYFNYDAKDLNQIIKMINDKSLGGDWIGIFGEIISRGQEYHNKGDLTIHISNGSLKQTYVDNFKECNYDATKFTRISGVGIDSGSTKWVVENNLNLGVILAGVFGSIIAIGLITGGIFFTRKSTIKKTRNKFNL